MLGKPMFLGERLKPYKAGSFQSVANQEILLNKLNKLNERLHISVKKPPKDNHLLHSIEDVVVDILLCVNCKGVI